MTTESRSPLIEHFRSGAAPRDARLLAARGLLTRQTGEQLALLAVLADDPDPEVKALANATIDRLPAESLRAFFAGNDVDAAVRDFYARRGSTGPVAPADTPAGVEAADADAGGAAEGEQEDGNGADEETGAEPTVLANLSIADRLKLAVKGTREQRAQLIRDSNKIVATAGLTSPKLTEAEVEAFVKMGNVS
jgi:hypothetical protein